LIVQAAEEINKAKKAIIIAGGGVILSKATDNLIELSERLHIPVATAFRRFHAFPNTHEHYAGTLGLGAMDGLASYIKESDLVIALGTKFSQMTTNDYTLLNETGKLIHVDISPDTLGKVYNATLPIVADVNEFLKDLLNIVNENVSEERKENLRNINNLYKQFSTPILTNQEN